MKTPKRIQPLVEEGLVDADGPVTIDLPLAVDAASNTEAEAMFARDVDNLATYFSRFAPQLATTQYAKEIWALYGAGLLSPETVLTGRVAAVMREIALARKEEEERLRRQQEMAGPSAATWARLGRFRPEPVRETLRVIACLQTVARSAPCTG